MFFFEAKYYVFHIPSNTLVRISRTQIKKPFSKINDNLRHIQTKIDSRKKTFIKQQTITSIALNIIQKCNLKCTYCYAEEGSYGKSSVMSFEVATKAINFFDQDYKNLHIHFFGGEPLLNFSLIQEIILWSKNKGKNHTFSITTNGYLLDQKKLLFLKKNHVSLKISYDGEKLQAKQRLQIKKSNFENILIKKLELYKDCLKQVKNLNFRSTLYFKDMTKLSGLLHEIIDKHKSNIGYAFIFQEYKLISFEEKELKQLKTIIKEFITKKIKHKQYRDILKILNIKQWLARIHKQNNHSLYCGAGVNYISVSSSGKFYLCHRFTESSEECLGDISHGFNEKLRNNIIEYRHKKKSPCQKCWIRNFCNGGCFYEQKMLTGKWDQIHNFFCKLQRLELELSIYSYIKLSQECNLDSLINS